ncbi:homoserine O-acetyltransferase [Nodosilinea sp. PGN35]|uniref:homoserine O-acetyltransferase MetX n=1 Tax=Nodosilinea sp. PGN35 TaxID=3020489 RepID=UPI0023B2EF4D|nr:homoserine O-acetyltransferase [Nodosilinea sp. TSF1-S3]MDF0366349.1 homoserine O-acetyltransferase [Nodosilinea sp. TSF1-S3]
MSYLHLVSPHTQIYHLPAPLELELGGILPQVQVAYRTWGELNRQGDNAVLVCHALTGTADVDDWWAPLLGPGRSLDPSQDFIVCSNILGSCYGTTGPTSLNPETGRPYGANFPAITVRDMVHVQAKLLGGLGIKSLRLVIGGSLGGMQVLEWGVQYPDRVESLAVIAASGRHSPWCIGLSEAQRQAIYTDPRWQGGHYSPDDPPAQGLAVARMIAMSTYRSWASFHQRFGRNLQSSNVSPVGQTHGSTPHPTTHPPIHPPPPTPHSPLPTPYAITHYLHRHGQKLVDRFDANTYITLTHAMDSHEVGGDSGTDTRSESVPERFANRPNADPHQRYPSTLQSIPHPALVVAIDSDILYPPAEQQELADLIPQAELVWLRSPHGHDAFLIDMDTLNCQVATFRQRRVLVNR